MSFDFTAIGILCITVLYFLLPAYISNSGGLIFGGGKPLDCGKTDSKGNRWIGDGVTWRGFIGGTILGTIIGAGILIGFLLAFGALVGDALGSFLKRRLGIGRGKPAPILDQIDFLIVALLFASLVVKFDLNFIIISIVLTLIIHLIANTGAYLLGMKDVWY